ncbi:MAG: TetR/AcrR family transcriptional regulator [Rhodococcus sp. (in: high G+C Gram-positive bacteria)]
MTSPSRPTGRRNGNRRSELLDLAAELFAENGLKSTTVRDIADAAGILSGSLYHHFDTKETMVDEILREFLDELFGSYREIVASNADARERLEALVATSFDAIDRHHAAVAIYQAEAPKLAAQERFSYIDARNAEFRGLWKDVLTEGVTSGVFRSDLDVELVFRFLRDTVWVAVRWYRPGGSLTAETVARQYLAVVLHGITADT